MGSTADEAARHSKRLAPPQDTPMAGQKKKNRRKREALSAEMMSCRTISAWTCYGKANQIM